MHSDSTQVGQWNGKSIPAFYAGVTFRSRTEARWAVFMNHIGVRWLYEHEGFDLPNGYYLPDFWLPQLQTYLEIKSPDFDVDNDVKLTLHRELVLLTGKRLIIFRGSPGECDIEPGDPYPLALCRSTAVPPGEPPVCWCDNPFRWCICWTCRKPGIEFDGRADRICRHTDDDKGYNHEDPLLLEARRIASIWRFS